LACQSPTMTWASPGGSWILPQSGQETEEGVYPHDRAGVTKYPAAGGRRGPRRARYLTEGLHARFSEIEEDAVAWASQGRRSVKRSEREEETGLAGQAPTAVRASPGGSWIPPCNGQKTDEGFLSSKSVEVDRAIASK
jgi:hypothetical protein